MPTTMKMQLRGPGVAMFGLVLAGALVAVSTGCAQAQPPNPANNVRSPEVLANGHVTFRIYGPAATTVLAQVEGIETSPGVTQDEIRKANSGVPMTKGDDGVWSVTLGPIRPGIYGYNFLVDGVWANDPRNPFVTEDIDHVQSLYEIPGEAFYEYKMDVPHGAIATVWYPSSVTGGMRRMHVYTPPGYNGKEKLPVLYLLHGATATDDAWPTEGRGGAILDNLIAEKKAVPMIVVMPAGHVSREFKMSMGPAALLNDSFDDDLVKVVIPYIDQHYATISDRKHRAIAGLSMGGFQTISIAFQHPELFNYVGMFSSGWFPEMRKGVAQKELDDYKAYGKPFKLVWVNVGKQDIALANSNATVELIRTYGIVPEVHESEGYHTWSNWREYLHSFAPRLFHPEGTASAN